MAPSEDARLSLESNTCLDPICLCPPRRWCWVAHVSRSLIQSAVLVVASGVPLLQVARCPSFLYKCLSSKHSDGDEDTLHAVEFSKNGAVKSYTIVARKYSRILHLSQHLLT